jgi:predicted transposase/invertase (TIGR01784 family)
MRFLDVKTDYAFKRVFGAEESVPLLISFLNAILDYEGDNAIVSLEILDPYLAPKLQGMKDTYVDVKAKLANKQTVIIEMQVLPVEGFEKRVLYNMVKQYSNQLTKGKKYQLLNPVIALTFTNFVMFKEFDKYQSAFELLEKETFTQYNGDIELVFIELPKFTKTLEQLTNIKDKWIYFIQNAGDLSYIPDTLKEQPCIEDAFDRVNEGAMSAEELEIQTKRQIFIQDQLKALSLAVKQGEEKGRLLGKQEGIELGKEQGKLEERLAIARNLLNVLDNETIAVKTGLNVEQIEGLR